MPENVVLFISADAEVQKADLRLSESSAAFRHTVKRVLLRACKVSFSTQEAHKSAKDQSYWHQYCQRYYANDVLYNVHQNGAATVKS
ncbi:hypothetical protein Tcan_10369 [Toxocara canis]|uniref:Uncharacterized protein n=1 Tax=Toxocara canis TaxID=6265 RepID=A0A0B2VT24_TOXCA|nr:hypothetical protein Tcan_10369 [Toxocara canis]